jgi:hypothetical protein
VLVTSHKKGNCAIIGGYVVRDPALTTLYGRYLFGDLCNPVIYEAMLGAGRAKYRDTGLRVRSTGSFGQDAAGHVYVTSLSGPVYELAPTYGPSAK